MSAPLDAVLGCALLIWTLLLVTRRRLLPRLGQPLLHGALGLASLGLALLPIAGQTLSGWLATLYPTRSVPLQALLLSAAWRGFARGPLLDRRARAALWGTCAAAGLLLFPAALGLGRWDPFAAGWGWSWPHAVLLVWTVVLYVIGFSTAHRITQGSALMAVLLPLVLCCAMTAVIVAIAGGIAGLAASR